MKNSHSVKNTACEWVKRCWLWIWNLILIDILAFKVTSLWWKVKCTSNKTHLFIWKSGICLFLFGCTLWRQKSSQFLSLPVKKHSTLYCWLWFCNILLAHNYSLCGFRFRDNNFYSTKTRYWFFPWTFCLCLCDFCHTLVLWGSLIQMLLAIWDLPVAE